VRLRWPICGAPLRSSSTTCEGARIKLGLRPPLPRARLMHQLFALRAGLSIRLGVALANSAHALTSEVLVWYCRFQANSKYRETLKAIHGDTYHVYISKNTS